MIRREVPQRRAKRIDGGKLAYRAWLTMLTLFVAGSFWCFLLLAIGCGRGGAAPCVPQPPHLSLTGTGPGGSAPTCEYRR